MSKIDSFKCRKTLNVGGKDYVYYSLAEAEKNGLEGISKLPYSMKVLLENLLRNEDGNSVKKADIQAAYLQGKPVDRIILYRIPKGGIPECDIPDGTVIAARVPIYGTKDAGSGSMENTTYIMGNT